jgi:hypothetical protein
MTSTVAPVEESLQDSKQHSNVKRVQPDGGLVEHEDGVALVPVHFGGELEALRFPARQWGVASPRVR